MFGRGGSLFFGDVEDRFSAVGVAGDEDALVVAGLHRRVDPPRTGVERGFLESQSVERRPTAGEREQLVGLDRRLDAVV